VQALLRLLDASVKVRVQNIAATRPKEAHSSTDSNTDDSNRPDDCDSVVASGGGSCLTSTGANVGVMFSGGLDSTLLAAVAHR
jgi:asparagine synthetase B (glutamine-hydrolysing)